MNCIKNTITITINHFMNGKCKVPWKKVLDHFYWFCLVGLLLLSLPHSEHLRTKYIGIIKEIIVHSSNICKCLKLALYKINIVSPVLRKLNNSLRLTIPMLDVTHFLSNLHFLIIWGTCTLHMVEKCFPLPG